MGMCAPQVKPLDQGIKIRSVDVEPDQMPVGRHHWTEQTISQIGPFRLTRKDRNRVDAGNIPREEILQTHVDHDFSWGDFMESRVLLDPESRISFKPRTLHQIPTLMT
jgi:hypothetical protein